ncbi:hypothetical protein IC582_008305 [Cucumis melo]
MVEPFGNYQDQSFLLVLILKIIFTILFKLFVAIGGLYCSFLDYFPLFMLFSSALFLC